MTDGITRFLPKYPNISKVSDSLINPYDGNFYNTIHRKKEFYDLRLGKTEDFPDQPGTLMNHQKIIARYLSSRTPYNGLLLFHEMGTGKTCSAVGAIEQIRYDSKFKGAIYVASKVLSDKFLHELLYTCTDGRYIPDDLGKTEETKERRHRKAVSDYYRLGKNYTYYRFSTRLGSMSEQEIRDTYSNMIIVIDEVHNITDTSGKKKASTNPEVYKNIWRLLHVAQGCKVLLLSGTPMRNKVSEIASVMNLILPREDQLPTGAKFIKDFFTSKGEDLNLITGTGIEHLQRAFKGRVSYLRAMTSDVKKVFKGKSIEMDGDKQYFKVVESPMSEFQSSVYKTAKELEGKKGKKHTGEGVHLGLRQASLLVFPDKSYGKAGFDKYVKDRSSNKPLGKIFGKTQRKQKRFTLSPEFKNILVAPPTMEEKINVLSKFSSKYADGVRIILESIKQNKLVFIYNEFVTGSGIIVFTLILDALGFSKVTGSKPRARPEKPTYATLTGNTPNITAIISAFNNENNIDGSRINVIIGSQTISEGVSLRNVQVEIIQTPWFNYARIDQAIARGYRVGSHRSLQKLHPNKEITLDVYQQISVPNSDMFCVEREMYLLSQQKDISIKLIERVIRESAFDCSLTYNRNHVTGKDGSRECDYGPCDYKCQGVNSDEYINGLNSKDLDYSTYQLYYVDKVVASLINEITKLFHTSFLFSLEEIRLELDRTVSDDFELITALESVISNSVPITNKYGFTSYLQESGNAYFLVDSLSTIGKSTLSYYTKYPCVKTETTYDKVKSYHYTNKWIPSAIKDLCMAKGDIKLYIDRLPVDIQELLLETAIIAMLKSETITDNQQETAKLIIKYFDSNLKEMSDGNIVLSSLLEIVGGPLKCLDVTGKKMLWRECTPEQTELHEKKKVGERVELEEYSFYGLINDKNKNFCIRDLRGGVDKKGHQLTSGLMCLSYNHWELNYIIAFHTSLMSPPTEPVMNILSSGVCGPQDDKGKKKQLPPSVTRTWDKQLSGIRVKDNKTRPSNKKLVGILDDKNKNDLIDYLQTSAMRTRDSTPSRPTYDDRNFKYEGPTFMHLLTLGGGKPDDSKQNKWKSVIKGISDITIDEMRRLIFFGSMKKADKCLFLCAWFKLKARMIPDPWCGKTTKPKPLKKDSKK